MVSSHQRRRSTQGSINFFKAPDQNLMASTTDRPKLEQGISYQIPGAKATNHLGKEDAIKTFAPFGSNSQYA